MHTEESPVGCEDTKDFVEPDEDLSNFQCREISPPDPEIQRFREPLGIPPSCLPPPIENDREDGRKVRNVRPHSPKLVGVKERAGSWRTNIKFNQIAETYAPEEGPNINQAQGVPAHPEIKVRVEPDENLSNF